MKFDIGLRPELQGGSGCGRHHAAIYLEMDNRPTKVTRRSFLRKALRGFLCTGLPLGSVLGYMRWEGGRVVVRNLDVPVAGFSGSIRLLHLTDLHYLAMAGVSLDYISHVVAMSVETKPDVILLTGDYIFDRCNNPDEYAAALAPLAKAAPAFASFGNHDGGQWSATLGGGYADLKVMRGVLGKAGIRPLVNESATVCDGKLDLVGLGDLWAGNFRPSQGFAKLGAKSVPRVVLSHNPDTLRQLMPYEWNLMLAGHTHGGQVKLPLIGSPWAPVFNKRYVSGLHRVGDRWLHVSRGIGGLFRMRCNCPPEIAVLQLVGK